jgi:hypothetical protein
MSNPIIRIHDTETNEIIDREMTKAEFTAYQADLDARAAEEAAKAAKAAEKAAVLAKLGLTAEELAALI